MFSPERVLVTGASGLVGAHIVRALLRRGYAVRALTHSSTSPPSLLGLGIETAHGDLLDRESLQRGVSGCDAVVHAAAMYTLATRHSREVFATNVEGTRLLAEETLRAGVQRVVYTSSVSAIGPVPGRPAHEEDEASVESLAGPYERSKRLSEALVRGMVEREGLPAVIVNPATVIGAWDSRPTRTGRLIIDAARGRMPAYVDTGMNVIGAGDVAEGHVLALERGVIGRRYILGNENLPLRDLLRMVDEAGGHTRRRVRVPLALVLAAAVFDEGVASRLFRREPVIPLAGVRQARTRMYYDPSRARTELGLPATPVREAVREALTWFREHGYL